MGYSHVAAALVIIAVICLASMAMSRDALLAVSNSFPCETTFALTEVESMNIRRREVAVPKFQVASLYSEEHARIDSEDTVTRCDRYNLKPNDGPPRRIFFGTLVADEDLEIHVIHAIEVYGIYHVAVFVESNTTFRATPKKLRFKDSKEGDQLTRSGMFGPETDVYLDFWLEDKADLLEMDRESEQRNVIIKRWKDAGMTSEDVGLLSDSDEIVSRDFLRAVQSCDFPELRPGQSCQSPKIIPLGLTFESSPYCIEQKPWYHPDFIGGQCVEGVGDPTERIVPLRDHERRYGERHSSYGKENNNNFPEAVHKSGRYPLFNGHDIRTVQGDRGLYNMKASIPDEATGVSVSSPAYHLNNWFSGVNVLRHKYRSYGHPVDDNDMTLSQIHGDLDTAVRCAKGLDNDANPYDWTTKHRYHLEGRDMKGSRPIYFLNVTRSEERHKLLQAMVLDDEEKFGSSYDSNGTWIENSLLDQGEREKAIAARASSIQAELRKNSETHLETTKSEVTVAGDAEETTLETKESEMTVAGDVSEAANERMVSESTVSAVKYPEYPFRNSSTATVMGMATGLDHDLSRFVNSLRKTGYEGHIILGVNADIDESRLAYFERQRVTPKFIKYSNCTYEPFQPEGDEDANDDSLLRELSVCSEPYLDVKGRWAKYPMGRDWLRDCPTCTGPVLITDVRDVFFQHDPFGPGTPEVTGLQVYEEHKNVTTGHWLVDWPVGDCKGVHLKEPMLCSGTTIGTREAMIAYLDAMYGEMKRWISDPKCRFKTAADDQSIHNWLFYNGDLKDAVAVKNREGVVNTVGFEGDVVFRDNEKRFREKGVADPHEQPFPGATSRTWISTEFGLTNEDGEFTNFDGTISPVVHQFDRLCGPFYNWMNTKGVFSYD